MTKVKNNISMDSATSEERFRQIFFAHLEADGFSEADFYRLIFRTPDPFHQAPAKAKGLELLEANREKYRRQLAFSWFLEGLNRKPEPDVPCLQAPEKPITMVIIPGIFGEFIEQLPFQEVVERKTSHFHKKWQKALESVPDEIYSLMEGQDVSCRLSDTVKVGSIDQGARSFANVIVLKASSGSLETLGSLASNVEVLQRRLAKVFEVISDDTDIYLVGYSRGLAVALDLISMVHEQKKADEISPESAAWFNRLKGVVGLGGVYYGANSAQMVLSGKAGATSEMVQLLIKTASRLHTVPKDAKLAEKTEIVTRNHKVWAGFLKGAREAKALDATVKKRYLGMDLVDVFAREEKARLLKGQMFIPDPRGIFSLVQNFFLRTFKLNRFVTRYNQNILALKELVMAVVEAVETLTPESRAQWWQSHELPADLVFFSLTGTMPDPYISDFVSPLSRFSGFGPKTSDYHVSLRSSYYDTLASEGTTINDSQVSHFCSRYWEEMYPEHQYTHHYLGVLGTHHWGMAFPYSIKDDEKSGGNKFPREIMLKAVASFIVGAKK